MLPRLACALLACAAMHARAEPAAAQPDADGGLEATGSEQVDGLERLLEEAEQGSADSQSNLGYIYSSATEPLGVEKNDTASAIWYERAAMQSHTVAQANYALALLNGTGVRKNLTTGATRKAARRKPPVAAPPVARCPLSAAHLTQQPTRPPHRSPNDQLSKPSRCSS